MRRMSTAAIVSFFVALAGPASAQDVGVGLHGGLSVPMGDYATTDSEEGGAATLGFVAGADIFYPLESIAEALTWVSTGSVVVHRFLDYSDENIDVDGGYLLVPIMTGLRFDLPTPYINLFVQGQAGVIFTKAPSYAGEGFRAESEFGSTVGFSLAAGFDTRRHLYGGMRLFPLSEAKLQYDQPELAQDIVFADIFIGIRVH